MLDKKLASQRTVGRLQLEYDEMVVDRKENDKQIEEDANQVETHDSQLLKTQIHISS